MVLRRIEKVFVVAMLAGMAVAVGLILWSVANGPHYPIETDRGEHAIQWQANKPKAKPRPQKRDGMPIIGNPGLKPLWCPAC